MISYRSLLLIGLIFLILLLIAFWMLTTAKRLDRLHMRFDSTWQILESALDRRAYIAKEVGYKTKNQKLYKYSDKVIDLRRSERSKIENEIGKMLLEVDLSTLPVETISALSDAQARVSIARRFHDDAVRDTIRLRATFFVKFFSLSGSAPFPEYFDMFETNINGNN